MSLRSLIWSNLETIISKTKRNYFSEIRNRSVFYLTGDIPKSKYCCYIVQPSMLCRHYVQFWQINDCLCSEEMVFTQFATSHAAQTDAYTLTLLAQNAREVTQSP